MLDNSLKKFLEVLKVVCDRDVADPVTLFDLETLCIGLYNHSGNIFSFQFKEERLYRARIIDDLLFEKVENFLNPPINKTKIGRANKQEQSVFYCCQRPDISLLETKPAVGQYIALASFRVTKPFSIKAIGLHEHPDYKTQIQLNS